jgi:hypothetical protein
MTEFSPHWDRVGQTRRLIASTVEAIDADDPLAAWPSLLMAVHAVELVIPEAADWPEVDSARRLCDELGATAPSGRAWYTLQWRARGRLDALRRRLDAHDAATAADLEAVIGVVSDP